MLWALVYPSWCGFAGLLLAATAVVPPKPADVFLPLLGYGTALFAVVQLVTIVYYLWQPSDHEAVRSLVHSLPPE